MIKRGDLAWPIWRVPLRCGNAAKLPLSLFSVPRGRANGLAYTKTRQRFAQALNEPFGVVDISIWPAGGVCRRHRFDFVQLKLTRDIFNNSWLDGALLVDKGVDQRMLAKQIDHARDAH